MHGFSLDFVGAMEFGDLHSWFRARAEAAPRGENYHAFSHLKEGGERDCKVIKTLGGFSTR